MNSPLCTPKFCTQACDKTGRTVDLSWYEFVSNNPKEKPWVDHVAIAWDQGVRLGVVRICYIPKSLLQQHIPTVWHHMHAVEGRNIPNLYQNPNTREKPIHFEQMTPEQKTEFLNSAGVHFGLSQKHRNPVSDLETWLEKEKHPTWRERKQAYQAFQTYHVNRPTPGFAKCEDQRKGVATLLYVFVAKQLAKNGLSLWASTNQTPKAKALWRFFEEHGWTTTVKKRMKIQTSKLPKPEMLHQHLWAMEHKETA